MDTWVVQQVSFWFTVYEIKPGLIVDRAIAFGLDVFTPGRGAGASAWWMRGWRAVEQSAERTSREMDWRRTLRDWDHRHPQIHHELILRYVCGAVASLAATALYNAATRRAPAAGHRRY
jgi:hypothetical protein